jgi:hypothetical protein
MTVIPSTPAWRSAEIIDGLRAGMKPMRDALKDAGLIDDDKPSAGHQFVYGQRIYRANRGVKITVEPRA